MTPGRVRVAPSLLSCRFEEMGEEIAAVQRAGADWLHFDVMDGHFVPNISIGPLGVEAARRAVPDMVLDVHLMISEPDDYIEAFAKAGADILTVHIETSTDIRRTLDKIRLLGVGTGVTLNPATPLETIEWVLGEVDMILVMSVKPGFSGQSFIPESIGRIQALREKIDKNGLPALLEVDGGVKPQNAAEIREAGADVLVAGSAVYGTDDYAGAIEAIRGEG
ncbi:MAG: ribulose-phosphate 3-epimerase [Nitrospinaceae bacterium]|nr:ribulose-phosphate 3-epimerase [Nitrospinaceae bacterium]MBT3434595.1 ribulose-phosphate 3-epimerase [Nitrospinaceae bacterium]MBT3821298.1 ribulose-phosphate 3-epimerase [Nitrospinaceae bacterium]MBT4094662.1 ribulose-phosphate 3-epimerase [Nitrospinaceae bacterium]MBT4431861.1 ribulose-phosphate 3-epimerase [Nitrospinaceae bacterium]